MNVEFIPVFYGAFNEDTAIAEVRTSIGDNVAVGTFYLKKPILVFDFTAFNRAQGEAGKECAVHTRYEFITGLHEQISKPVLPFEKQREYIATKIIAEYLKTFFKCDAVIFESSMSRSKTIDNKNIVLLNTGDNDVEFFDQGKDGIVSYVKHYIVTIEDIIYKTAPIF